MERWTETIDRIHQATKAHKEHKAMWHQTLEEIYHQGAWWNEKVVVNPQAKDVAQLPHQVKVMMDLAQLEESNVFKLLQDLEHLTGI